MDNLPFAAITEPEIAVPVLVALLIAVVVSSVSFTARTASAPQKRLDRAIRGVNAYGAPTAIILAFFVVTLSSQSQSSALVLKFILISLCVCLTALLPLAEVSVLRGASRPHQGATRATPTSVAAPTPPAHAPSRERPDPGPARAFSVLALIAAAFAILGALGASRRKER